ncbi:hypothetical protein EGK65_12160 [Citrobacter farmeri]|nr:hypothetical protein EGK65_12160 [Citrobacter farmeri]
MVANPWASWWRLKSCWKIRHVCCWTCSKQEYHLPVGRIRRLRRHPALMRCLMATLPRLIRPTV